METACPACGEREFRQFASATDIDRETALRERFIGERSPRPLAKSERKDLTEFAHNEIAPLLACARCCVLLRAEARTEPVGGYVEDDYDFAVADRLYPRYVEAFRAKRQVYGGLLPAGAEALEVGSHLGAFLQVAKEWGWRPTGVDVGEDTSEYARSKGHAVLNRALEDCRLEAGRFDGVFIWNCFEQIPDPHPALAEARRILKRGGLLVVRTPNALFYRLCTDMLKLPDLPGGSAHTGHLAVRALAYNNLLAFPYLYGYDSRNLELAVERHGFAGAGRVNSELIAVPLPNTPAWVAGEERSVSARMAEICGALLERHPALLAGPWIELLFRAV